ncbi:hypothetical protein HRI_004527400 [Hibiscus trionum]|uniref:Tf2-1-like SH3-like domain-containing protein n=1 Tax=Hibiscus trionum TaxID=183268 RepID=A0A9W7J8H2_HIBTR|nr:hypothetical protein HRI_004527400 [Hibiscus trionum]
MKLHADRNRRELEFAEGDWVFVRLQLYRQLSLRLTKQHKLSPCYFGSYCVLQRVGSVAYKLDLPESSKIHPVIHVSKLRACKGRPEQQITPLPLLADPGTELAAAPITNLEDKVSLHGGGNVTSGHKQHELGDDNDETRKKRPT